MDVTKCRIVEYTPGDPNDLDAPQSPAIVSRVNKDGSVDLTVFPPATGPYSVTNVTESESGGSENGKWNWPQAAPAGSAPETDTEQPDPAPPVGGGNEGSPEGGGEQQPADSTASNGEQAPQSTGPGTGETQPEQNAEGEGGSGETPTTSAASAKPLYQVVGEEVPAGMTPSGLETPEGVTLYVFEGDTAGQQHTFDVGDESAVKVYAEADDNDQPVKPAATSEQATS